MTMKPLPARNMSFSGGPAKQPSALYMPASAPATTTSFFNFNYPSPSSTSPSSTSAEFLDCTMNASYVNPADLFNTGSLSTPQNFATPASTTSNSSMIPPTPPFSTYLPSVAGSLSGSISGSSGHRISIDSSVFDISTLMNTLGDSNTQYPQIPDETNTAMLLDTSDTFSPPELYDITSPASFTNDSGVNITQCNTAFQFSWQPTLKSHGNDEYNTGLPFEPSTSAVNPMDIIMKQSFKLGANNPFTPSALNSTQLFSAFPDSNDVFDLLIDDRDTSSCTKREIVDAMLRGNLIATAQSAGVVTPEMPAAVDLSTYVNAYWEFVHPHMPVFFKPSFVAQFVQEGVLLAMCSLGALTVGATQHSLSLSIYAKAIVKKVSSRPSHV
jgi:Fungal specific transcription factor domain